MEDIKRVILDDGIYVSFDNLLDFCDEMRRMYYSNGFIASSLIFEEVSHALQSTLGFIGVDHRDDIAASIE